MEFNTSDLQRMLLDSAERYIAERFTLEHRRALRDNGSGLDEKAWATFAELGWLALAVPETLGGLGGSSVDLAVLAAAFGTKCVCQPFVGTAVQGAYLLAAAEEPRTAVIEQVIGGTALIALVHGEPGERYAEVAPRRVTLTPDGNGYILNGQKFFAVDAPLASHLVVSADIPGRGLALILVPSDNAGIAADAYPLLDGSRAADLQFENVWLGPDAVLATGTTAEALLGAALDQGRLARLAQAVGSMEEVLRICSAYLKERRQFGQPIGSFQALQHIMADMFVAAHQSRSALYQALAHADRPAAERSRSISLAAITIGEAGQLVSRQAIQLHGGYGLTDEYEVGHHYRYLLTLEKLSGDIDFHMARLAAS